jgi:pimeloyl-ACP methyl ester carboxylesterase
VIYLIPGLGADAKVFKNLQLKGESYVIMDWIKPIKKESLANYAQRLAETYFIPNEEINLVGLSMGGMIAKEIYKSYKVNKCIIISSIQVSSQFSPAIKLARLTPLYKIIPIGSLRKLNHLTANYFFSVKDDISRRALHKTIDETDPEFLTWAIGAILEWKCTQFEPKIIHIHGDRDRIFPIKNIDTPVHVINKGGHWMIVERGKEISELLLKIIYNKID